MIYCIWDKGSGVDTEYIISFDIADRKDIFDE